MTKFIPLTPRCAVSASCPGVWKQDGVYVIVGRNVGVTEYPELEGRIGPDECAVEIPTDILEAALSALAPVGEDLCQADAEQVEAHHRTQERPLQSRSENAASYRPTHRHYKGGLYQVLGHAMHTEMEEMLTIYRDADGEYLARPKAMFEEPGRFIPLTAKSPIEEPKQREGDDAELQAKSFPDTNNSTESTQ